MNLQVLQALHQLLGNNTPQAKRYAKNPTSKEFVGRNAVDPAQFGYPADNSGGLQVHPAIRALMGIGDTTNPQNNFVQPQGQTMPLTVLPQGGRYNPGLTPLQGGNVRYNQNPQPTRSWYDL